jgi:hypothetical protein
LCETIIAQISPAAAFQALEGENLHHLMFLYRKALLMNRKKSKSLYKCIINHVQWASKYDSLSLYKALIYSSTLPEFLGAPSFHLFRLSS